MPWWVFVAGGNFLLACAIIFDKFLVSGAIPDPRRYTMLTTLLAIFNIVAAVLVVLPGDAFRLVVPEASAVVTGLSVGALGAAALFFLFYAMKLEDPSRVGPLVGASNAVATLCLAALFLGERLSGLQIPGVGFLLFGGALLAFRKNTLRPGLYVFAAALSGVLFAASWTLHKFLFTLTPFLTAVILTGFGQFLVGVALFATSPRGQGMGAAIRAQVSMPRLTLFLFGTKQIVAALGTFAIVYAISLTNVSLVNTAEGVKYAFLFVMVVLLSLRFPWILKEDLKGSSLVLKVSGTAAVAAGLALVALQ